MKIGKQKIKKMNSLYWCGYLCENEQTQVFKDSFPRPIDNELKQMFFKDCIYCDATMSRDDIVDFYRYWFERDKNGKYRFQNERYFELKRRLATWKKGLNKKPYNILKDTTRYTPL